jgi:hypothetical protein
MGHAADLEKQVPSFMVFIFPERWRGKRGFSCMEASAQYRQIAEECRRFAQSAKTEEQRKVLREMEAVWMKLAKEADERNAGDEAS